MRRTHFLSVETTTIYLLLKYYPVENRLELIYRLKKRVTYELRGGLLV